MKDKNWGGGRGRITGCVGREQLPRMLSWNPTSHLDSMLAASGMGREAIATKVSSNS